MRLDLFDEIGDRQWLKLLDHIDAVVRTEGDAGVSTMEMVCDSLNNLLWRGGFSAPAHLGLEVRGDACHARHEVRLVHHVTPGRAYTDAAREAASRATPDGNTILMQGDNFVINAILHPSSVTYNPLSSFDPICLLTNVPQVLVVNSSSAFHSLADFLAAAKARPGELLFASFGPGTSNHIVEESLKRAAKVDWTYVPYPGGDVPAVTALLGGHVTAVLATYSAVIEQVTSGTLRPLAVAEPVRIPQLPNVPTMAESAYEGFAGSGFKGFLASRGLGLFAPARTPKEVIAHLSTLFVSALKAPEVTSKLLPQGLPPVGMCGAEFAAQLHNQYEEFGRIIREANIKAE